MATKKTTGRTKSGKPLSRGKALKKIRPLTVNNSINWGDIKGGSTDDKHKDWSEILGSTTN